MGKCAVWAAALGLLSACEFWVPESFPARMVVLDELSDEELAEVQAGAEAWNDGTGLPVWQVVYAPGGEERCDQVNVRRADLPDDKRGRHEYRKGLRSCSTRVLLDFAKLGPPMLETVAHELGHALGLSHSSDDSSIMYSTGNVSARSLQPADIEQVRALVEPRLR